VYASRDGDLSFTSYGRHARAWVNSLGAQWRNELQLGGDTLLSTSLFQPLDASHRFFVEPRVLYSRSLEDIFRDGERVARLEFRNFAGQLDLGVNMGRYAQARIGYIYDDRDVIVDIGSGLIPDGNPTDAGLLFSAEYDSRDTAFNPTRGLALALEYMRSEQSLGASRDWERAEFGIGMARALSSRRPSVHSRRRFGSTRQSSWRSRIRSRRPRQLPRTRPQARPRALLVALCPVVDRPEDGYPRT
jgi:NTE family protein